VTSAPIGAESGAGVTEPAANGSAPAIKTTRRGGRVVLFFLALGGCSEVWGELQWEWPGFFLTSAGSWASVLDHGVAALWRPARA
jgi:hypothetical protein